MGSALNRTSARCVRDLGLVWALHLMAAPLAVVLVVAAASSVRAADAEITEIGETIDVQRHVTGQLLKSKRRLKKGMPVRLNEIVETGKKARGEFRFKDDTKLAVGPRSKIVLDTFIYDPNSSKSSIIINMSRGAFRFVSGKSGSTAYKIITPTATLGVRGTVFDVYVADNGEAAVLLHEGAVDVCSTGGRCRLHKVVGQFFHINGIGRIIGPLKWDGSFFTGLAINAAFPFVGRRLKIDPIRRFRHAELLGGKALRRATGALRKPGRAVNKAIRKKSRRLRKFLPF